MFKITAHPKAGVHVRIEGRLTAEAIPDVLGLVGSHDGVTIDLSGLTAVDAPCRNLLAGLCRRGHRLLDPSPYIARLLQEAQA